MMPDADSGLEPGPRARSLRRILVPVDACGGPADALAIAAELSGEMGGELRLVHVRVADRAGRGQSRFYFQTDAGATEILEKALSGVWARGARASGVVVDADRSRLARVIAEQADAWGAGLIVVSRRPRGAIGALLLGSVSQQVMRAVSCPVLVTRGSRRVTAEVSPNVSR